MFMPDVHCSILIQSARRGHIYLYRKYVIKIYFNCHAMIMYVPRGGALCAYLHPMYAHSIIVIVITNTCEDQLQDDVASLVGLSLNSTQVYKNFMLKEKFT